jgi:HAD superfamily hydrolase (TIGR01509 family)
MIKLVILDAGNVLFFAPKQDLIKTVNKFLSKHGMKYFPKVDNEWKRREPIVCRGKISLKEAQEKWLEGIGMSKELQPEWARCDIEHLKTHRIKNGVKETLRKLKKRYNLAVLSDCPHEKKITKMILRTIDIDHFFDEIFTSYDIGFMKPEKEAYLTVLNHFKVKPSEAIFVSDEKDEIDWARKIGIKTVFFSSKKYDKADFSIRSFPQILKILESEGEI